MTSLIRDEETPGKPGVSEPPLLSPKEFAEFSPGEFLSYVEGLFVAPAPRKAIKLKEPPKIFGSRTKTGKLSFRCARKPLKWVTEAEMTDLCRELEAPENELFIALRKKGLVLVRDREEARELATVLKEIPF